MTRARPWHLDLEVVLRDLDGLGHVNNAVYATYLETARNKFVAHLLRTPLGLDFVFILARLAIDFRRSAILGQTLRIELWPTRVGDKSFDLAYTIRARGGRDLQVEATSVQVCYDYAKQASMPVPPRLRAALERELRRLGRSAPAKSR